MKKKSKNFYLSKKWIEFTLKVKQRDQFKCCQCGRGEEEVILQVHHQNYIEGKLPWEYLLSDCITLCKGCHARTHSLIEPSQGWTLISIDDLEELEGTCERQNCGNKIRYEHLIYHPAYGYKIVGSTCVEYLIEEDQILSNEYIQLYKQISQGFHKIKWFVGYTKKRSRFIYGKYNHHVIRIYGSSMKYSFQLVLKEKGVNWHQFKDIIKLPYKDLDAVKELAFIVLKGTLSKNEDEKSILRNIYRRLKVVL